MTTQAAGTVTLTLVMGEPPRYPAAVGYGILRDHPDWEHLAEPSGTVAAIRPGSILGDGFDAALKANRQGYDAEQAWLGYWAQEAPKRTRRAPQLVPDAMLPPPWQRRIASEPGPLGDPGPEAAVPAEDSPADKDSTEGETA